MSDWQIGKTIEGFIAKPLIILIALYMVASTIDPLLHLNNQTFRIIFTLAGGFPTLIFFFKTKRRKLQT